MNILMVAAEAAPFVKVGGLGDVVGSLPKALKQLGHDVRVVIPRYAQIDAEKHGLSPFSRIWVPTSAGPRPVDVFTTEFNGVPFYFIWDEHFFGRNRVYGYYDDPTRFAFFGLAALWLIKTLDWRADIVHSHDWHTGVVPTWMAGIGWLDPAFAKAATVFTIHNIAYQGHGGSGLLDYVGLRGLVEPQLYEEPPGIINWMARGIYHAHVVNAVSPRFAWEITTPEGGAGLDGLLRSKGDRLVGILNGIDTEVWNPAADPHLAVNYDVERLDRRIENKRALQEELKLPVRGDVPLIANVGRLSAQKGLDILIPVLEGLMQEEAQVVILGSGDPYYEEMLSHLARRNPTKMAVSLEFSGPLASRIYAGSDIFVMPSLWEPCGLSQMIAMRYGSVPLVRRVGGLADTVQNYDPIEQIGTGFVFDDYTPAALWDTLVWALGVYRSDPLAPFSPSPTRGEGGGGGAQTPWRGLQIRGMRVDFSWEKSARQYQALYEKALVLK